MNTLPCKGLIRQIAVYYDIIFNELQHYSLYTNLFKQYSFVIFQYLRYFYFKNDDFRFKIFKHTLLLKLSRGYNNLYKL